MNTVLGIVQAIIADVAAVGDLLAKCFSDLGVGACTCNLVMSLQPEWRRVSNNPDVTCTNGDPFGMLMKRISESIGGGIISVANTVLGAVSADDLHICNPISNRPLSCFLEPEQRRNIDNHYRYCEDPGLAGGLDKLCH